VSRQGPLLLWQLYLKLVRGIAVPAALIQLFPNPVSKHATTAVCGFSWLGAAVDLHIAACRVRPYSATHVAASSDAASSAWQCSHSAAASNNRRIS
jgi:hypothetical protein